MADGKDLFVSTIGDTNDIIRDCGNSLANAPFMDSDSQVLDDQASDRSRRKIYTVGTLHYTQGALWVLFSWLMWNDLCLMLMENVAPTLVPFLLKDHGASNRDIAFSRQR